MNKQDLNYLQGFLELLDDLDISGEDSAMSTFHNSLLNISSVVDKSLSLLEEFENESGAILFDAAEAKKHMGKCHHKFMDSSTSESLIYLKAEYYDKLHENE